MVRYPGIASLGSGRQRSRRSGRAQYLPGADPGDEAQEIAAHAQEHGGLAEASSVGRHGGLNRRMAAARGNRMRPEQRVHRGRHRGRGDPGEVATELCVDRGGILAGCETEVELRRRPRRDDGLCLRSLVAAGDAVDGERGARRRALVD